MCVCVCQCVCVCLRVRVCACVCVCLCVCACVRMCVCPVCVCAPVLCVCVCCVCVRAQRWFPGSKHCSKRHHVGAFCQRARNNFSNIRIFWALAKHGTCRVFTNGNEYAAAQLPRQVRCKDYTTREALTFPLHLLVVIKFMPRQGVKTTQEERHWLALSTCWCTR